jgi:hypothetical protein
MYSNQSSPAVNQIALSRCLSVAPQIPDELVMELIADGDGQALNTLYIRHHAVVCRFVGRLVGEESAVEDIANFPRYLARRRSISGKIESRDLATGNRPP